MRCLSVSLIIYWKNLCGQSQLHIAYCLQFRLEFVLRFIGAVYSNRKMRLQMQQIYPYDGTYKFVEGVAMQ